MKKFLTKRFLFSAAGLGLATFLTLHGTLSGMEWVYALFGVIAGHHAEDIIRAWKGGDKNVRTDRT